MKRFFSYRILCVWCVGLASCSTLQTLTFDQLNPSEVSFPESVRNVAVVNNMPHTSQPKENQATLGVWNIDGKSASVLLAEALADTKYFSNVMICDSALNNVQDTPEPIRKLSPSEVNFVADELNADMVFSFDRLVVQSRKEYIRYPGYPSLIPVVKTVVTPVLSVYKPGREEPVSRVACPDSMIWNIEDVPSDGRMAAEVSHLAASALSQRLTPFWQKVERPYFIGGAVEMRDAAVAVREGDWNEACRLWKSVYDRRKKGSIKNRAALNLVLGNEMTGNLDEASLWLNKALQAKDLDPEEKSVAKFYVHELEKRKKQLPLLNVQMKRFDSM